MQPHGAYLSGSFTQRIRRCFTAQDGLASENVSCVFLPHDGRLLAGTDHGLFRLENETFRAVAEQTLPAAIRRIRALADGTPVICAGNGFYALRGDEPTLLRRFDDAAVDFCNRRGLYWFLTETELCVTDPADGGIWVRRSLEGGKGQCLAVSQTEMYVATETNLSVIHGKRREWKNILPDFSAMPRETVRDMEIDGAGHLWLGSESGAAIYDNTNFWLLPQDLEMLPRNAVRAVVHDRCGGVWFASDVGVILLHRGALKYFSAERWVPSDHVTDIAVSADAQTVYAATDKGIAQISCCEMTLRDKADYFENLIETYHVRRGFVSTRIIENKDMDSGFVQISDNDGLWTSMNLAAESLRYAVTGEAEALRKAKRGIQATLLLTRITGIPGFTARAVRYPGEPGYGNGHKEWSKAPDGITEWKGETSSDEMTGHFFGGSLYYDLCADEAEKTQIRDALCGIVEHILSNDYCLVDRDGKPTTWACWDPALLNHDDKWVFERGVNSLELLAFLKVAHHISGDAKYDRLYRKMIGKHHYALNAARHKIRDAHICHIDDNLAFLASFTLLRLETDPALRAVLLCGMEDHWRYERPERQPMFCFMHALFTGRDADLAEGVQSLREMALDTIHYSSRNSARRDLVYDTEQAAWNEPPQLLHVLPYDERNVHRPDFGSFKPDETGGTRAQEATYFLLPYWIARYYGLLKEASDAE